MSTNLELEADEVCASCGMAAIDNIKLKLCDGGCDLVKYCHNDCQANHREQHEDECKKRLAEMIHDKDLFTQPDSSYLEECPICFLPLPIDQRKSTHMTCCSKTICNGCDYANKKSEGERGLEEQRCAFCREPLPTSQERSDKQVMERVKKNDPVAMGYMGIEHLAEGNYGKALEYFAKAAELGDVKAHCSLGMLYYEGFGVEKDKKKAIHHYEQAAIGGHTWARVYLARDEMKNNRFDRAARHYIIAANLGCDSSLQCTKDLLVQRIVSEEEYAAARRGYQAAVDETKSAGREAAEEAERNGVYP
jgi:tetratricopeptide (TPR) repeat protein